VKCWWNQLILNEIQLKVGHNNRETKFSELDDEAKVIIEKLALQQQFKLKKGSDFK